MDIQELGSLGELIAALATLATLAYLAMQIRQNTLAIKGSTLHSVTQTQQNELHWGSVIAGVFTKAIENQTALTPVEAWQMSEWLMSAMAARQNEYVQYRHGHITQEVWQASESIIRIVASFDWGRNWWVTFGHMSFSEVTYRTAQKSSRPEQGLWRAQTATTGHLSAFTQVTIRLGRPAMARTLRSGTCVLIQL